ncbi:MAG TPA: carbamoyltransferase C-terminal domain-containing protein [Holophagaceae bacterium]|nr:carbamoyltransferase C-terminal domain-containing protein [Holophagaceae bacterium]
MLICGINSSHSASAALVRDGRLLWAIQEERPTREKNRQGFPIQALRQLLALEGVSWKDVDAWAFGGFDSYFEADPARNGREARIRSYKAALGLKGTLKRFLRKTILRKVVRNRLRERQIQRLVGEGVDRARIHSIEHHRCHAATAFYGPGMDPEALVVTIDGAGDSLCATISLPGPGGRLERLASVHERNSIGNLWEVITALMGMVPNEHEYKLMGMAPYAGGERTEQVKQLFRSAFVIEGDGWHLAPEVPDPRYAYAYWRERLEFVRFDHLCAGLQAFTEEFLTEWILGWLRKTGRRKLRCSGGVFMNVKLNKILGELPEVEDLFVFPSCGDETNAIGAAWAHMADQGLAHLIRPLETLYLGPEPTDEACTAAAEQARSYGWQVSRPPEIEAAVAELLARGEVVARASGREEFGARSLGNRAILADPTRPDVVKVVNKAIKSRDFWMPFAPSVLAEAADEYMHNPKGFAAPYMILAFDSRHTDQVKAACHPEDGTIRPQVVTKDQNPSYHRLLEHFRAHTGRGALMNTSFNIHGEPIVSTPADAVDVMKRSGLRHLALGPFLISKPSTP